MSSPTSDWQFPLTSDTRQEARLTFHLRDNQSLPPHEQSDNGIKRAVGQCFQTNSYTIPPLRQHHRKDSQTMSQKGRSDNATRRTVRQCHYKDNQTISQEENAQTMPPKRHSGNATGMTDKKQQPEVHPKYNQNGIQTMLPKRQSDNATTRTTRQCHLKDSQTIPPGQPYSISRRTIR